MHFEFTTKTSKLRRKTRMQKENAMIFSKMPRFGLGIVAGFVMAGAGLIGLAATQTPEVVKNIVLVHGAWADGSSWDKVVPLLEAKRLSRRRGPRTVDLARR